MTRKEKRKVAWDKLASSLDSLRKQIEALEVHIKKHSSDEAGIKVRVGGLINANWNLRECLSLLDDKREEKDELKWKIWDKAELKVGSKWIPGEVVMVQKDTVVFKSKKGTKYTVSKTGGVLRHVLVDKG